MSVLAMVQLEELMATRLGGVNPSRFPDETFELFSIPAYEGRRPEVTKGGDIGSTKQLVQARDVLLSKIVPHIRRSWIVGSADNHRQIASGEWIVFRSNRAVPEYLRHVLLGDDFHAQFMRTVSGVGGSLLRARPAQVAKIAVPLPPLAEQRRIASILDKADALRTKRREALTQLDRLAQSLFVEMFGDPVTNPKGWEIKKFGVVGSLDRGVSKHRPRNDPALLGGSYPLIQTGDVANCRGYIRVFQSAYSELGLRQSKLWPRGTLCITIAANIAKTGILKLDACFPDSVVGFTADEDSTVEYVRVWLSFLQKALEDSAPESAQKNINLAILRNLDIPLPPLDRRKEFARALGAANLLIEKMVRELEELNAMFSALQHRAFQGEL